MKRLIPLLFLILSACDNKKAELLNIKSKLEDSLHNIGMYWLKDAMNLSRPVAERKAEDTATKIKVSAIKHSIDSIETELKKYQRIILTYKSLKPINQPPFG